MKYYFDTSRKIVLVLMKTILVFYFDVYLNGLKELKKFVADISTVQESKKK